ncbi:unnamed protein product [Blumeria hordei]|uniref:Uncharacterized protein n=1 Tax=Blumeria hordei TaxID=2867405 RepID=A0A383UJH5_BLUHO|nr:unnamed protein product [Blumeria hordei]
MRLVQVYLKMKETSLLLRLTQESRESMQKSRSVFSTKEL